MHRWIHFAAVLFALLTVSCAVPLGPGFYVHKENLEVRFVPGAPPHLEVRSTFELENSGNRALDFLDAALPESPQYATSNLRAEISGVGVVQHTLLPLPQANASPEAPKNTVRIPFTTVLPQKGRTTLTVSYEIRSISTGGIAENSFYLHTRGWYPLLLAPQGMFSKGDRVPKERNLSVRVPNGFLAHSGVGPRGKRKSGSETEYRFRFAEDDFLPFVVAGRYSEAKYKDSNGTILFWTFAPLPPAQGPKAGARLAASLHTLEALFGPMRQKQKRPVLLVMEAVFREIQSQVPVTHLGFQPGVAMLSANAFEQGVASADFTDQVEQAWAWTWTVSVAQPNSGADETLGDALNEYAKMVVDETRRGAPARELFIHGSLSSFDSSLLSNKEIPIALLEPEDGTQLRIGAEKAALFLIALEDAAGAARLRVSIKRMLQALRGTTYGYSDLRAALEAETGKDFGEIFRRWLAQPGIPDDFRWRYAPPSGGR